MTVKQLREWLIKQDDTGDVSVRVGETAIYRGDFEMSVTSHMKTAKFVELPDPRQAQA